MNDARSINNKNKKKVKKEEDNQTRCSTPQHGVNGIWAACLSHQGALFSPSTRSFSFLSLLSFWSCGEGLLLSLSQPAYNNFFAKREKENEQYGGRGTLFMKL